MTAPAGGDEPIRILHREERPVAVDKPSGLLVHRGWDKDRVVMMTLVRYGDGRVNRLYRAEHDLHRLALHAWSSSLEHPRTGEPLRVDAPLDPEMAVSFRRMGLPPASWEELPARDDYGSWVEELLREGPTPGG